MKVIGIAGGSGTGKTTISRHLVGRGGVHIDGDVVGHEILNTDETVISAVREKIGPDVMKADGHIDRRKLASRVFADAALLKVYNGIIHPAIRRRCGVLVEEARSARAPFVAVDAALLLDSKMPFAYDVMIALRASRATQMARILAKGNVSAEDAGARLDRQEAIEKSFYKADVVVDTDRALDEVIADVDRIVDELLAS